MDNEKTTNVSTSKENVQIPGKYRCKLFSSKEASAGKGELDWLATADCPMGRRPKNPSIPVPYHFTYNGLIDLGSKAYEEDLIDAFNQPDIISVEPQFSDHVKLVEDRTLRTACDECFASGNCKYENAFCKVYKNYYFLEIKFCPWCGKTNRLRPSSKPTGFAPIHDVRRDGYPSLLCFKKIACWTCTYCGKTVSGIRVPRIQHVLKGGFTLRLLRSLFELGMDKVPNEYVAEGYCLRTNTVDKQNKKFRATSKKEFVAHLVEVFSEKTSKDFYEEEVFLGNRKFIAIFDKKNDSFLTILSANELENISDFFYGKNLTLHQFKSANSLTLATQFFLTKTFFVEKELIESVVQLNYACLLDHKEDTKSGYKKRSSAPEWKQKMEEGVPISYYINELYYATADFSRKAFNFQIEDFKHFDELISKISEIGENVPSTYRRTLRELKTVKCAIEKIKEIPEEWEERFANEVSGREYYCLEGSDNTPYRDVCKLIESCSKDSEFSLSEQLARLQYYNELSVFPISPSEQEKFPVLNEKGWPSFENTRLGQGIPVECLTHLLNNGLLDKEGLPPACIRHRLGLAKHEYSGSCTIENCPFLS